MKGKLLNISLSAGAFFLMFCLAEVVMRCIGYYPGDLSPGWFSFTPVDSLKVDDYFYTNKQGILVAGSSIYVTENVHVNEDGFRSPSFTNLDTGKRKIMFIGDSFTWGKSAVPVTGNCFVDLVRNETNFEVINLGIPAADPVQYYELAKKYVPLLKPQIIFVMFFMGNDLMTEDRTVVPGKPFCYATNAGLLFADMDGRFFPTAQQAYAYLANNRYYLKKPANAWLWIISKSALLSRLYAIKFRIKEKYAYEKAVSQSAITKKYLYGIQKIALQYGANAKFVLIPELKDADMDTARYKMRFNSLLYDSTLKQNWIILKNSKQNFTPYPDAHLNNKGHRYYATFLETYLQSLPVGK